MVNRRDVLGVYGVLSVACLVFGASCAEAESLPAFTHPLLRDLKTYCYACHHGRGGETFDKFSRQPAFFAAATESELIQNIREIAARALRYLRSKRMPKAMNPFLPMAKRREMVKAIKALAVTPPTGRVPVADPAKLVHVRKAYDRHVSSIIEQKCGFCHGQSANHFQALLFGGTIRLARREWDSSTGYPFGGDYARDPVLQLSMLEVVIANGSMPPPYYVSTFPAGKLSDREVARILDWIENARALYDRGG